MPFTARNHAPCWALALLVALAVGSTVALLWGLRFTNHDDIYFHLAGFHFRGDYLSFAEEVAIKQARLQAFLNMPLTVWALSYSDSWVYDLLTVLPLLLLYGALALYLGAIGGIREGIAITSMALFLLPLHSYFTFPQGYPIMGPLGPLTGLMAGTFLAEHLRTRNQIWRILSITSFAISLWGAEYNAILHPLLIGIILWTHRSGSVGSMAMKAAPFASVWILTIGGYLVFSTFARTQGADLDGRVSMGFNPEAYVETFMRLTEKAFLPAGLIRGITFTSVAHFNTPPFISLLTYNSLMASIRNTSFLGIPFIGAGLLWILFLICGPISRRHMLRYLVLFFALATVPTAVVSASSHYQSIVTKGYLQGHLVSFYAQLGLNGIAIVLGQCISWLPSFKLRRLVAWPLTTILFSAAFTFTLAYNNLNRSSMLANQQRWPAVQLLASYINTKEPELSNRPFIAPALWNTVGVGSIPSWEHTHKKNYWRAYSELVLRHEINFLNKNEDPGPQPVYFWFQPTSQGEPLIALAENAANEEKCQITFLTARSGRVEAPHITSPAGSRLSVADNWNCTDICTLPIETPFRCESIAIPKTRN